jgi:hypothetical protein
MGNFNDGSGLPNGNGLPSYSGDEMNILAASIVILFIIYGILFLFTIACYIIQSLGLYNISKRRGFDRPWYAWIPIANSWLIGRLSDLYQWVTKGKRNNRGKLLLWIDASTLIVSTIIIVLGFIITSIEASATIASQGLSSDNASTIVTLSLIITLLYMPMLGLSIVRLIFYYMALYDIFASCDPDKKVVFIVLSIIFGIQAFFIFAVRNKDLGMHPEQPQYVQTYM